MCIMYLIVVAFVTYLSRVTSLSNMFLFVFPIIIVIVIINFFFFFGLFKTNVFMLSAITLITYTHCSLSDKLVFVFYSPFLLSTNQDSRKCSFFFPFFFLLRFRNVSDIFSPLLLCKMLQITIQKYIFWDNFLRISLVSLLFVSSGSLYSVVISSVPNIIGHYYVHVHM